MHSARPVHARHGYYIVFSMLYSFSLAVCIIFFGFIVAYIVVIQ